MSSPAAHQTVMKQACTNCARRKIRCDRQQPCSNCVTHARTSATRSWVKLGDTSSEEWRNNAGCEYIKLQPAQRHRRKATRASGASDASGASGAGAADDLRDRLRLCEDLLQKNNISSRGLPSLKENVQQKILPRPSSRGRESVALDGAGSDDRVWIASPWEAKTAAHKSSAPTPLPTAQTPSSAAGTIALSEAMTEVTPLSFIADEESADSELELWYSLPLELRNVPISSVFARRFFGQKTSAEQTADSDALVLFPQPSMPIASGLLGMTSPVPVEHPEPRVILRLWQVFIDNVNPLMRIVHVPTTHQQIIDASWEAAHAPPATGALLFAIYSLALTSMSEAECSEAFSGANKAGTALPSKRTLLLRYRLGATQCLLTAGLLTTRRVEVLRAFTLLILAEPDSELSSTLAAIAMHLGLKMGLHLEPTSAHSPSSIPGLSFFEREMRLRLWWQIRGIDARMRQAVSMGYTNANSQNSTGGGSGDGHGNYYGSNVLPPPDINEMRLPLNVNDADLHPDMAGPPVEHTGPTEMLYVRMKYETALWMRSFAKKKFASACGQGSSDADAAAAAHVYRSQTLPALKDRAIDELEKMYADGCLKHCDPRIPLHDVTANMARMVVAHLRYQVHHPRTTAPVPPLSASQLASPRAHAFSRHNADAAFNHALGILEMCFTCRHVPKVGNSFVAFQLLADVAMRVVMDATVYVVCMLRVRTARGKGSSSNKESIDTAWRMIELFYNDYGDDLAAAVDTHEHNRTQQHAKAPGDVLHKIASSEEAAEEGRKLATGAAFVTAFRDLTLEAWDAREASLEIGEKLQKPAFIANLQSRKERQKGYVDVNELPLAPIYASDWGGMLFQEQIMDWEYWNSLLQM